MRRKYFSLIPRVSPWEDCSRHLQNEKYKTVCENSDFGNTMYFESSIPYPMKSDEYRLFSVLYKIDFCYARLLPFGIRSWLFFNKLVFVSCACAYWFGRSPLYNFDRFRLEVMGRLTKFADFAQKTISFGLFGITVYLLVVAGRGAYFVSQRRKERLALLEKEQLAETTAKNVEWPSFNNLSVHFGNVYSLFHYFFVKL